MTEPIKDPRDSTTLAPDVLVTIAQRSALDVDGVIRMAPMSGGVNRLIRRSGADGARIRIEQDCVRADLYIVVAAGLNLRAVSRQVQEAVTRAIEEIAGLEVAFVNIHIEDVVFD